MEKAKKKAKKKKWNIIKRARIGAVSSATQLGNKMSA